jgi:cytochrome P450
MPPQVFFRDPRDIGAILSAPEDTLRPGEGGATVAPIVGQRSFMLADGGSHLAGRKATVASFNLGAVGQHASMIEQAAERMLATWPEDLAVPLHDHLRALTLEVILRTLTGH